MEELESITVLHCWRPNHTQAPNDEQIQQKRLCEEDLVVER